VLGAGPARAGPTRMYRLTYDGQCEPRLRIPVRLGH